MSAHTCTHAHTTRMHACMHARRHTHTHVHACMHARRHTHLHETGGCCSITSLLPQERLCRGLYAPLSGALLHLLHASTSRHTCTGCARTRKHAQASSHALYPRAARTHPEAHTSRHGAHEPGVHVPRNRHGAHEPGVRAARNTHKQARMHGIPAQKEQARSCRACVQVLPVHGRGAPVQAHDGRGRAGHSCTTGRCAWLRGPRVWRRRRWERACCRSSFSSSRRSSGSRRCTGGRWRRRHPRGCGRLWACRR